MLTEKKKKPGRPYLPENKRLINTAVRLPKDIHEELKKTENASELMRGWIVRGFKRWRDQDCLTLE